VRKNLCAREIFVTRGKSREGKWQGVKEVESATGGNNEVDSQIGSQYG
jgi:hypothetical protein